jgi:hypothetical protein
LYPIRQIGGQIRNSSVTITPINRKIDKVVSLFSPTACSLSAPVHRMNQLQYNKRTYLNSFNTILPPLHSQDWVINYIKEYDKNLASICQHYCDNCCELWPSLNNKCKQCSIDPIKFSKSNNMIPNFDMNYETKKCFELLTMIEEMLISPIFAVMSIFRLPGGQLFSRGYMANFTQDINDICRHLPRLTNSLPLLIIRMKNQKNENKEFVVNKKRIEICLRFLIENNPMYIKQGIKLNLGNLAKLPENSIPSDLNEDDDVDNYFDEKLGAHVGPENNDDLVDNDGRLNEI